MEYLYVWVVRQIVTGGSFIQWLKSSLHYFLVKIPLKINKQVPSIKYQDEKAKKKNLASLVDLGLA